METYLSEKTLTKSLSVSTFEADSGSKIPKKRQSMQRRLSGQRSVEDLLKNIKIDQLIQKTSTEPSTRTRESRTILSMQNIAKLSQSLLKAKYATNPFFQVHIKHLSNQYKSKQNTGLRKLTRRCSLNEQQLTMMSYKQHLERTNFKQTQIFSKVMQMVNEKVNCA